MKELDESFNDSKYIKPGNTEGKIGEARNQQYVEGVLKKLESDFPEIFNREIVLAGAQKRKLNSPSTETAEGTVRGSWHGSVFILDNDYVPEKYNDAGQTIAQIKKNLFDTYGISVDGIPYVGGIADFSTISVANIPIADIISRSAGMTHKEYEALSQRDRTKLFQTVFSNVTDGKSKRKSNFEHADQIASERQIPIPGLQKGYTALQLKKWRSENKFSWDEQVNVGYNLVPSIIHGNLSHTGVVSTSGGAHSFLEQRDRDMQLHPESYCWDENRAPITIDEVQNCGKIPKRQRKGERNMAMRSVLSKGMNLGRHGEVGYTEIHNETGEQVAEGDHLHELGTKFEADKTKLENEIEKVQAANISAKDKKQIIAQLNVAIEKLQEQYDEDVVAEETRVQEEIQAQLEQMEAAVNELEQQADSLRNVTMEAASTDTSAAIDAAEAKKREFEQMKEEYTKKLQLQMEQAEIQQRNIRARRLSDR